MVGEDSTEDAVHVPEGIETRYPIEPEHVLTALLIIITLGVTVAGAHLVGIVLPELYRSLLGVLLLGVAGLYIVSIFSWLYEVIQGWRSTPDPVTFGPDAVQVRILTINAEATVQKTVNELPDTLTDRHVIAETPIEIDGATVHVVPDEFECVAKDKGRALEWARRTLSCEKEYVLFLDEDTLVPEFPGLPDADLIQFREYPMKTDSWWAFWAEIIRMGWQLEQTGFRQNDIPMYTWGGGLAVRKQIEDEITWNFESLIEDSVFAWLATKNGASYDVVEGRFRNQAPPSIPAMVEQRRRWVVGTIRDET
ncbi:MAG: glycosyltransferase family 2 protein, partial [Halobacteriaceae archaeon]